MPSARRPCSDREPGIKLDATEGRVRLQLTNVVGTVADCRTRPDHARALRDRRPPSRVLRLRRHRRRRSSPTRTRRTTRSTRRDLNMTDFEFGEPARALGFMTPFGEAPPDFAGQTMVDFDNIRALLGIGWSRRSGRIRLSCRWVRAGSSSTSTTRTSALRRFIQVGPRVVGHPRRFASPMTVEPDDRTAGRVFAVSVDRDGSRCSSTSGYTSST